MRERVIRGGVQPDVAQKERGEKPFSIGAHITRRSDDGRARLKCDRPFHPRVGERLLCDGDYETLSIDVYAVHVEHDLIDVHLVGGLDAATTKVTLRRTPWAA